MDGLDARLADFEAQNLFYVAVQGAISATQRLERILETYGSGSPVDLTPAAIDADGVLCFVLGLIAFRDTVLGHITQAIASEPPALVATEGAPPARSVRGLLR